MSENMKKILIIDDDLDYLNIWKIVLENNSFEVITASTGEEGLALFHKENPDLIILDIMMETPDKGFRVGEEIKKKVGVLGTPIIIASATTDRTNIDIDRQMDWIPAEIYMEKPLTEEALLKNINVLLKRKE
ncbi:MAG: response regulator [Thermodesulfobacteriota bacterium]|nr:response regulator [Thermodesulfobacteriota bacterium]